MTTLTYPKLKLGERLRVVQIGSTTTEDGWEETSAKVVVDREEWRDHTPSGYEDQSGYGQVSCSCGWDSESNELGWVEHIDQSPLDSEDSPQLP